jgi:putative ABC transport system permease protein
MFGRAKIILILRSLFKKRGLEQELDEELQFHLEREIEANIAKGMGPEAARQAALYCFGGVEQVKEACREERGVRFIEELGKDVLYGCRMLRKHPGFTAVAVLTLMLGIGANTAIFSVVNGVLLRPLPFPDSDRIVTLWNFYPQLSDEKEEVSPPDFHDWLEQNRSFAQLAAYERFFYIMDGDPYPLRLPAARVSGDFFAVMGVNPILGRSLLPADDHEGLHHVVVLSHRLWTSRFGADSSIVGRIATLNGMDYTVVGIMPAGFGFPYEVDLWSPMAYEPPFEPSLRTSVWLRTVGRLEPSVTLAQAQSDMSAIAQRLEQQYPDTNEGRGIQVVSLYEQTVGDVRLALLVLLGAVGFVLLIACTNLVNLLLARATGRQQEIALRAALGASRLRLIRQLVTESTLLGLLGGAGGVLFAWLSLDLLRGFDPEVLPRLQEVQLDWRVLGFAMLVSLATGVACGIVPAWLATRKELQESLKEGSRRSADSRGRRRVRSTLVIIEVALAQVLLIGGGLLFQSFLHMRSVSPGFNPEGVLVGQFELFTPRYAEGSAMATFYREVTQQVAALPGVEAAALSTTIPFDKVQLTLEFVIDGRPRPLSPKQHPLAGYNSITPDYFRTMGIRLRSGRFFSDADRADAPPVVIINEALARRYWPGESPLGHLIRIHDDSPADSEPIEVVGVVENVRQVALNSDVRLEIYLPYAQRLWRRCFLLVRSEPAPAELAAALRREIHQIDANIALSSFRSMNDHVSASLDPPRFHTFLLGVFATLALTLAAVGVFGVISYSTSQRTREFGIRLALGAQRRDVFRLVVGGGFVLVLTGVALGLILALALTQALSSMLFGIVPTDPATYGAVALVLSAVALLACYLPSRRAMKVDPVVALRYE